MPPVSTDTIELRAAADFGQVILSESAINLFDSDFIPSSVLGVILDTEATTSSEVNEELSRAVAV